MHTTQFNQRSNVAGVVVLYNSSPDCLANINTYLNQIDRLYVVDNSPTTAQWITDYLLGCSSVWYSHLPQNEGIAAALNRAAQKAINEGYEYLLTMDDDSRMPENAINTMLAYLSSNRSDKIGIVSPRHILLTAPKAFQTPEKSNPAIDVLTTMTSGNLINLDAYQDVGPFDDRLFIDVVDHDFNLRLKASGYRIIELTNLPLIHRLGTQKKIPLTRVTFVSHSPIRNYYLIRNSLLVAKANSRLFPGYWLTAILTITIEIIKILLLENQRTSRVKLAFQGVWHGLMGRSGKFKF